jgi:hypothetical protein
VARKKGKKKKGGQEQHQCHVEGEMLHTALAKATGCEFIKIYDSVSDIKGVKGLRAKGIHFMLGKWGEQPKICTNQCLYYSTIQNLFPDNMIFHVRK